MHDKNPVTHTTFNHLSRDVAMSLKLALFLLIAMALLLGLHFVFARSLLHFFSASRPEARQSLYAAMLLLAASFPAAFFLLHWRENGLTIFFYRFAAVWMGFWIHFLVATALIWLILGVVRLAGTSLRPSATALVLLAAAACFSLYGIWNAFHPRVREITVSLPNLPPAWNHRTLVHLSDLHLGNMHGAAFTRRLVREVNALKPDLILITGDLFDGMGGPFASFLEPLNGLKTAGGIFFVTGNHENYIGVERALGLLQQTHVRVLDNELVTVDGLELLGVSYPGIRKKEEIRNLPRAGPRQNPRILLFHTPTHLKLGDGDHMDRHFSTYWLPDTSFTLNQELGVHLQLSGHTHHGQLFPLNFITRLLYRGHDYGLRRHADFTLYTTCGAGTWGPPMRTIGNPEIVLIRLKPA